MAKSDFENGRIARVKDRDREQEHQTQRCIETFEEIFRGPRRPAYNPPSNTEARAHYDEGYHYEQEQNG